MDQPIWRTWNRQTNARRRLAGLTAVLALLCLAQGAWAHSAWPIEYSISYKSYTSPTENTVELSYKTADTCIGNAQYTSVDSFRVNWCKPTDSAWDGQFWGPWNVGPDPQPQCKSDWKADGTGGWKYESWGEEAWPSGNEGKKCNTRYKYDLPDALAPGLWAIGLNNWDNGCGWFHHDGCNHNTNRVLELEDPNAPDDDEDDD